MMLGGERRLHGFESDASMQTVELHFVHDSVPEAAIALPVSYPLNNTSSADHAIELTM